MRTFRSQGRVFGRVPAIGRLLLLALLFHRTAAAQSFEIVHSFGYGRGEPYGTPLELPDGRILGTTQSGGDFESGSIYVLTPDGLGGYHFAEIYSFRGPDGSAPVGALFRAANGALYGVTNSGGAGGFGTVYRIDANGALTTLHHFGGADGSNPLGGLTDGPDGALYGLCSGGGAIGYGAFYRISLDGDFELRHSFGGDGSSLYPIGELLSTNGALYGVAYAGGASSQGTVFRVELDGTVTHVHEFNGTDGMNPVGGLVLDGGKLYGATAGGGDGNSGTVFFVDPVSQDFQVVRSLLFADGTEPLGRLLLAGGKLYGTAHDGGANGLGSVFRVDPSTGDTEAIHSFAYGEGAHPKAGLMQSASGDFFGTTFEGTDMGWGTVYRMDDQGAAETLHTFYTRTGYYPQGVLLVGGDVFGVTTGGGGDSYGTAFREPADGPIEFVHEFAVGVDGGYPNGSLLLDGGSVYGTASLGGTYGAGTAFRFDSTFAFEKLHDFTGLLGAGAAPRGGLLKASDGKFYGATLAGGTGSQGTLYSLDPQTFGEVTIHSFTGNEGGTPICTLVEGSDAKLYGTTNVSPGTVFRSDTSGNLETVHTFDPATEGTDPIAGLLLAQDGFFYGTASSNGPAGGGSVLRMDGNGTVGVVHAFDPSTEGAQAGLLVDDSQGRLVGTAIAAGPGGWGTVFRLDPAAGLTVLHAFAFSDGAFPQSAFALAGNGDIYGATEQGGPSGHGTLFRISAVPSDPVVTSLSPSSGRAGGGTTIRILGAHFPTQPAVAIGGQPAGDVFGVSGSTILVSSPVLSPGTLNDVTVSPPGSSAAPAAVLTSGWFADFSDVPAEHLFHDGVEAIFRAGVTAGCGAGIYCPSSPVTRAQMAVFLLKAEHGAAYAPPACVGEFSDVPCPGGFAVDWIEQLAAEGVTAGCGNGMYCPGSPVTRAQMAVFLLKALMGSSYAPPAATGTVFDDVAAGAFAAAFIEDLAARGITGGCSAMPPLYCPSASVSRGQMAVFLDRTFLLP